MPLLQPTVAPKNSSATKGIYLEMRKLIHDLKLPLTLENGELEAIEDGVRAWTPETTRTLLSELEQIKGMLEAISPEQQATPATDTPTEISSLLMEHLQQLSAKTTLNITQHVSPGLSSSIPSWAFKRILHHLSSNSVQYTYHPGCLHVSLTQQQQQVLLLWQDSAPAPAASELAQLGNEERQTPQHETVMAAGTGLTQVTTLVNQVNGNISFQHNGLGGLTVAIKFPLMSTYGG